MTLSKYASKFPCKYPGKYPARFAILLGLAVSLACGTGQSDDDAGSVLDAGVVHDAGNAAVPDVYTPGISKEGVRSVIAIVAANPAPPDRGDNTWTLDVTSDSLPVTGATVVVSPFMPAHGHGTTPASFTATADDNVVGRYTVGPFDIFMPGLWQISVAVEGTSASGASIDEAVMFEFAIEG